MKKNVFLIVFIILFLSVLYIAFEMLAPTASGSKNSEIEIPAGSTFRQAVDILAANKLIRDKKVFIFFGRLTGADRKIRAGYYSLWNAMSPLDILRILRKGRIIEYEVTILEGDSLLEMGDKFSESGIMSKEVLARLSRDQEFLEAHEIDAPSVEGYVFPDTYKIPKGIKPEDALGLMVRRMREKYSSELAARAEEMGITENQVLTLASIIEKEAVVDSERPIISAVYHNRLKRNMPLQADPTSIYGIKSSKEKITRADLQRKTPYNTYQSKGLPPGPIASPGLKSITAALYPAKVDYLYFVAQDDRTHKFSTTVNDHYEAVRSYRQKKNEIKNSREENNKDGTS